MKNESNKKYIYNVISVLIVILLSISYYYEQKRIGSFRSTEKRHKPEGSWSGAGWSSGSDNGCPSSGWICPIGRFRHFCGEGACSTYGV